MPEYTSATERFAIVCREIHTIGEKMGAGTPMTNVLGALDEVNYSSLELGHTAYLGLITLATEARDEVHHLFAPLQDETIVVSRTGRAARTQIDEAYLVFARHSIHSTVSVFQPILVDNLDLLAGIAARDMKQEIASETLLDRLRQRLESVVIDVLESDLDAEFKEQFLAVIERSMVALRTYRIYGTDGVDKAVGQLIVLSAKGMRGASDRARSVLREAMDAGACAATILDYLKVPATALLAAGKDVVETFRLTSGN